MEAARFFTALGIEVNSLEVDEQKSLKAPDHIAAMSSAIEQPPPSSPSPAQSVAPPTSGVKRIMAIDALRGFDMFWILGADAFVRGLEKINGGPIVAGLAAQLEHKDWRGFAFYDLIFPLFVFIVGVSLV